ncbi:unnamed protein product [Chondrus crispus]|uniref:Protein kinase domain-containing protein n=1 Tax=Chondrus crispus TaxID=2769 RepID=R7QFB4_CHOCR|nr:unnamed protein product [Chondrus crispus]CDF37217.1 unnamed protein product [Chondrus crispus]|eukprot:XP_005717036.1 unnamed protein product [Chondrus crispus]
MAFASATTTTLPLSPRPNRPPYLDPSRISLSLNPDGTPQELARGTCGIVYAAMLDSACPVAAKILDQPPDLSSSTRSLQEAPSRHGAVAERQFQREARRYAALRNVGGVAAFFGVAPPTSDTKLFATERMWGGSLQDAFRKHGTLDPASSLRIAHNVAITLAELHRLGFTHGDLKSASVLFSQPLSASAPVAPETVNIKLVGFQLSRSFSSQVTDSSDDEDNDESVSSRFSAPGRVEDGGEGAWFLEPDARGTPAFLSPEAWCGSRALRDRNVAEKADVYALAMLLYELETGTVPWNDLSEWGIYVAVCNQGQRPVWPNRPERIPGLRAVVEQSWVQNHHTRPSSQQVAEKLLSLREEQGYTHSIDTTMGDALLSVTARSSGAQGDAAVTEGSPETTDGVDFPSPTSPVSERRSAPDEGSEAERGSKSAPTIREHVSIQKGPQMDSKTTKYLTKGHVQKKPPEHSRKRDNNAIALIAKRPATHALKPWPASARNGAAAMGASQAVEAAGGRRSSTHQPVMYDEGQASMQQPQIAARSAGGGHSSGFHDQKIASAFPPDLAALSLDSSAIALPKESVQEASTNQVSATDPSAIGTYEHHSHSVPTLIQSSIDTSEAFNDLQIVPSETVLDASVEEREDTLGGQTDIARPIEQRDEFQRQVESSVSTDLTVPDSVRSLNYAFKTQVMNNDCAALCKALEENERHPYNATRILEALCVLLENDKDNCEYITERRAMRRVTGIVSRYGSTDSRLCKTACLIVYRMAACQSVKAESELRTTGSCEIVLNSIQWHPANLPVVQNAACAINILCRVSPVLCSILLNLGGADCALRVLARGSKSFGRDVPVASAGLEVIGLIAQSASGVEILAEHEAVRKVLECCDIFKDERIDRHVLGILFSFTRHPAGQSKILSTTGSMTILYPLIVRIREGVDASQKLKVACDVVSALAVVPSVKQPLARSVFLSSYAGEEIVQGVGACAQRSAGETNLSDAALMVAGFECFRSMSSLGQDVCGALQMAKIFEVTRTILERFSMDRRIAAEALLFLHAILRGLRGLSFGGHVEIVSHILNQLQNRWQADAQLRTYIAEAKRVINNSSNQDESQLAETVPTPELAESKNQPRTRLRLFLRRQSWKNR